MSLSIFFSGTQCRHKHTAGKQEADLRSGKHVVFGEVVSGLEVVKAIEKLGNKEGKMPSKDKLAVVKDCGVVKKAE
jgi:cyclophilin family peptidyl-prolyl cis-trans isomerase